MKSSSSYQDLFGIETARVTPLEDQISEAKEASNSVLPASYNSPSPSPKTRSRVTPLDIPDYEIVSNATTVRLSTF